MESKYNPSEIEKKWQEKWALDRLYVVRDDDPRPKWYALTMFPYTSGDLHIGHWYAMGPADVHARFKRMNGFSVLHPIGFDAFGLPAENAAISRAIHPYTWTMHNIDRMRAQLKSMGSCYDWEREVITCLPEYYRWTQWIFLQFYKNSLAYRSRAPVNWCPRCQTVLANEQVAGEGVCERCSTPVTRKDLEQWFFRITKYAEELLDHSKIDWPERIKIMQKNWIGKSEGAEISFDISHMGLEEKEIKIFTTRPDTLFGVTFMVLAPENSLVSKLTVPDRKKEVQAYIEKARRQSEIQRLAADREKDGVFLGSYAINQVNGEKVPLWIADYVLSSYGTGAVMGVPAHDTRDFVFAKKYGLPIRIVIAPEGWSGRELEGAWVEKGTMVNSGQFNSLPSTEGSKGICDYLENKRWGKRSVTYRLRDWLISRQRYWGSPIPVIYCADCGIVPVPEEQLPVLLPPDADFKPTGESPLKYNKAFVNTTCPQCHRPAQRETDTMDTFICSSWYYLRYTSPKSSSAAFEKDKIRKWLPVNLYTGGAEHANMHLLYARFFAKAFRDLGLVHFDEPFTRLFNQGIIIYKGHKMSKSRGNVVTPDPYIEEVGADAVRIYLMFVGPWELGGEWSDAGINGMARWLNRVWNIIQEGYKQHPDIKQDAAEENTRKLSHFIHKTIKRVTLDIEDFHFNTMVSGLMEYTNYLAKVQEYGLVKPEAWNEAIKLLLLMMAPSTPHLAEELWGLTGHIYSIHQQAWPKYKEELAREEEITLVIQVNGHLRDRLQVSASISEEEAKRLALSSEKVKAYLNSKKVSRVIYVPGRLINVVVG